MIYKSLFIICFIYILNIYKNLEKYSIGSDAKGFDLRFLNTPKKYETMIIEIKLNEVCDLEVIEKKIDEIMNKNKKDPKKIEHLLLNFSKKSKYELLPYSSLDKFFFVTKKNMSCVNKARHFNIFSSRSPLNLQLALNKEEKTIYGYGYHGIHDGLKILDITKKLGFLETEKVDIKYPKFRYVPFFSEYLMGKSIFKMIKLKKASIIKRENNRTFNPDIINFTFDLNKFDKIEGYSINTKLIGIILYSLMDSNKYNSLNVSISYGVDAIESQRNQTSVMIVNIKYNNDLSTFIKNMYLEIKRNAFQVLGLYFSSTFRFLNNMNYLKKINKEKVDISISSLPITKSDIKFLGIDSKLKIWNPYHMAPIYSLNYISNNLVNGYVSIKSKDHTFRENIISSKLLNIL